MVETVKQAESGEGLVVRLYEFGNRRGPMSLVFGRLIAHAEEVNLVEEESRPLNAEANQLDFTILPYEIKTFRVRLA
jgi:alpha-mannosidase